MPLAMPRSLLSKTIFTEQEILSLFNRTLSAEEWAQLNSVDWGVFGRGKNMGNQTLHVDDPEFDWLHRPAWRGLILTLYISVIVIGLVGNVVVVFIVARNKHMQNVTNLFIANLALSDIGLCLFSLPVQLYYQITNNWIFGQTMCKLIFAAFAVPLYVSTLTILLIACDRYRLIVYPLKQRISLGVALTLIIAAAVLSIILALPVVCFTYLTTYSDEQLDIHRKYCLEEWPSASTRITYSVFTFLFQFCLPLMITALLYYKIYCRLKRRPIRRTDNADRTGKTNKIIMSIVVLFTICWLPWNLYTLVAEMEVSLGTKMVSGGHFKFVDLLLKMFAMSSACINPFLYCWLNDNFRKELDTMAIKLRIIREPSFQRAHYHRPPPTVGENGHIGLAVEHTANGPNNTSITMEKSSHFSTVNTQIQQPTSLLTVPT